MADDPPRELLVPPDLSLDEVRALGLRASQECADARARAHALLHESQELLARIDRMPHREAAS